MPANHAGRRRALRRPATFLATLAVTSTGLLALSAPAAEARLSTTLVASPWRAQRAVGQSITYTFTLSSGSTRIAGKTIRVYTKPYGTTTWTPRWTRTLNTNGQTSIPFTVSRSLYVQARFGGTTGYAPSNSAIALVSVPSATIGQRALTEASHHQGAPYQYGADGPYRFDCSGFTRYVWSRFGKSLPHNSGQQYGVVRHIGKTSKQIGDLIFIYSSSGIYHVGIYAGNGYFWHSPHSGDVVRKSPIWTSSYYVGRVA